MKIKRILRDQAGASAIEFALTFPIFLLIVMAIAEGGLLMWTELGLQHGAEKAARCASVDASLCGSTSDVLNYAAQSSYGLNPPPSVFSLTAKACGNEVSANLQHNLLLSVFGAPSITVKAQSCFPSS